MIPLSFRPFNDISNPIYDALNKSEIFNKIDIQKAKFDEMHILDGITTTTSSNKIEWNYNTICLSQFKNNLEAGNLGLNGMTINSIKIKKRKKESLIFEDVKTIPFENNKFDYTYEDKFVESIQDYVYALQPLGGSTQSPILGQMVSEEIYSEFESAWLIGKDDEQYQLTYDLNIDGYETVIPQQILETIGNQFPSIISNGNIRYRKGRIKARLVSNNTVVAGGEIDKREEKKLRQSIMKFLTNNKPKIYKEGSGEYMLISIMGTPLLSPDNSLRNIYDISCEFVEIGNTDTQSLINNGLVVL